jgi:multidrug efflux system outer membrane protein
MRDARLAACAVLLAGCTLAPKYQRPAAPVAQDWPASARPSPAKRGGVEEAANLGWRDVFADARLQALVALALKNNRDLRIAALNVNLASARYRVQRAALLPEVDASGSFVRQRTPLDQSASGQPFTSNAWTLSVGVPAWELDFFGRVRSLKDVALESWLATEEAHRSAHLAVVAAVVEQELAARALDEQLAVARQTVELVQASLELTRRKLDVGQASEVDIRTAEAQLQAARASVAVATQQRAQAENALTLLVGAPLPANLPAGRPIDTPGLVAQVPAGVPSELLQRRPDILAAEHDLLAANANIGAARAAFFPSITLTAFGGFSSTELSTLFDNPSGLWGFSPRLNLPIFTGGRNVANLQAAKSLEAIRVAQYERAIQVAFREVADALAARAPLEAQIEAHASRVAADQRRYELSQMRYDKGVDSYLVVLTAQQDLYAAQQLLIQARLARLANLVELYRALGGGWIERAARPAADGSSTTTSSSRGT